MYKANLKTKYTYNQVLTNEAKHTFQWSRVTATCSCGWWTLWHSSLDSAKRSHAFHRSNMQGAEGFVRGRLGKRPKNEPPKELVAVNDEG